MTSTVKKGNIFARIWEKLRPQKRSVSERVIYTIVFLVFLFMAATYVYVLLWCFMSGAKEHREVVLSPFALPTTWHFRNYLDVFDLMTVNGSGFFRMLLNSLYFSVLGGFLTTFSSLMLAYVTAKYKFPGRGIFFGASLVMILLPIYGQGGSMYLLLDKLEFINSPWMILSSLGGFGMNYMYFHAFFQNLSWGYAEAAEIDGAGEYGIFFRIMLPLAMPMFGAVFLMVWLSEWNNYASALLYLPQMKATVNLATEEGLSNFWTEEYEGKAVTVKLRVYDGTITFLYKIEGSENPDDPEDGYITLFSVNGEDTPYGYVRILTENATNIIIVNLDANAAAVALEVGYAANGLDGVQDYDYTDSWSDNDLFAFAK